MEHIDTMRFSELDKILKSREIDLEKTNAVLDRLMKYFWEDKSIVVQLYNYKTSLSALS